MSLPIALVLAACFVASYFDVGVRRIPNWLTGSLAAAAVGVHSFAGLRAALLSITVMAVMTLLGTLVYSWGGIGGGDVKLAVAASGMLSFPLCLSFLLYSMLGGGLLAIAYLLFRGDLRQSFWRTVAMTASGPRNVAADKSRTLPYAVAFTAGAGLIALSQSVAPFLRIFS